MFGCRCRFAKPWTSIATQRLPLLIVCLGLFGMDRRCAYRSVRGIGVLRERLESRRLFMLLDRSCGALVCCVPIDRSVCVAPMYLEQVCCVWRCRGRAGETKHETYSVTLDLALFWLSSLWKSNRFLKGSPVKPTKNRQEHWLWTSTWFMLVERGYQWPVDVLWIPPLPRPHGNACAISPQTQIDKNI